MALVELTENISKSADEREITVGIFIDLTKAFDTVNHEILQDKLYHYGIRGLPHKSINSYFDNMKHCVGIDDVESTKQCIYFGVPQDSILVPLLFIIYIYIYIYIYINDLNNTSSMLILTMYAVNTNIVIKRKSLDIIPSVLNFELDKLCDLFAANLLLLNVKQTNYIIFGNWLFEDALKMNGKSLLSE